MTKDQPSALPPTVPSFEVPLAGHGPLADSGQPTESSSDDPAPNRRKIACLASLGGIGIGILVSVVLLGVVWSDDGEHGETESSPSQTADRSDAASLIPTPPTLSPLDRIPAPDRTPTAPAGQGAPVREGSLLDQIIVPTYPPVAKREVFPPDSFDLFAAVSLLAKDVPRLSSTRLELGVGGFVRDYTILRDPVTDRYQFTTGGLVSVVDETTGLTYLDLSVPGDEQWVLNDNRLVADHFGVESVSLIYDRLLLGPIRLDTISSASLTAGDFVIIDDGNSVARAFTVDVPGSLIPEWQLFAFGPTSEFMPSDRPTRMTYTVYVDEHNQIRRIVGLSDLGGVPQLVVHDLGLPSERIPIELPDPATINTGPPRFPTAD
mgnify:FL=1